MKTRSSSGSENGAALLVVLLLVATIAALSLTIVQTVSTAYRTTLLSSSRSQILWFAMGAEDIAMAKLRTVSKLTEGRLTSNTPGLNETISYELPGGSLSAVFSDTSNCFNLNSLAQTTEDAEKDGAIDAGAFYHDLLTALGFDEGTASALTASAQDWIDPDTQPRTGGAETSYYAGQRQPYAAGNTLMVTPLELRAVRGYSREVFQRIRPYVCTFPGSKIGPFNINTLTAAHAPLLMPVFANEIPLATLEAELQSITGVVHDSVETFLSRPTFAIIAPDQRLDSVLSDTTGFFRLSGEVVYLEAVTSYEAVFARDPSDEIHLVRRRLGVDE